MRSRFLRCRWLHLCAVAVLLASCGGGGGSGGSETPAPSLALDETNAQAAAARVVSSLDIVQGAAEVAGAQGGLSLGRRVAGRLPAALSIQTSQPCDGGGSVEISFERAELLTLSVGDSASFSFQACTLPPEGADTAPITLSGGADFTVTQFSGDPLAAPFDATLVFDFNALSASGGDTGARGVDGAFSVRLQTEDGNTNTATITSASLAVTEGSANVALSSFSLSATRDETADAFEIDARGTLTSSDPAGAVTFETLVPIAGTGETPDAGTLKVTGADGTSVTVVIVAAGSAELRVDRDGDGGVDAVVPVTWAELTP